MHRSISVASSSTARERWGDPSNECNRAKTPQQARSNSSDYFACRILSRLGLARLVAARVKMMRSYTVKELDALRYIVENKYLYGHYDPGKNRSWSRSYDDVSKTKAVEEMVRTHMQAGHTADDLIKSEE